MRIIQTPRPYLKALQADSLVSLLGDKVYRRLLLVGGGTFRDVVTRGAMWVILELISQLENESSLSVKKCNQACRQPFLDDARNIV